MPEEPLQQPAAHERAHVRISDVGGGAVLRLKAWSPDHVTGEKPVTLGSQTLPSETGATSSGPMHALCVGPGEWLVVSREDAAGNLRERIEAELPESGLVLVDLSDGLAQLEVSGAAVRELLSKGCGLDLHPERFPPGRCARTRFTKISVVIECLDGSPRFELIVARSYLCYLQAWIADAAVEFQTR